MLTGKCHEDKGQSFMSLLFRLEKASWRKWFKAEILRMSKSYQSEFITYIKISYMVGAGFWCLLAWCFISVTLAVFPLRKERKPGLNKKGMVNIYSGSCCASYPVFFPCKVLLISRDRCEAQVRWRMWRCFVHCTARYGARRWYFPSSCSYRGVNVCFTKKLTYHVDTKIHLEASSQMW